MFDNEYLSRAHPQFSHINKAIPVLGTVLEIALVLCILASLPSNLSLVSVLGSLTLILPIPFQFLLFKIGSKKEMSFTILFKICLLMSTLLVFILLMLETLAIEGPDSITFEFCFASIAVSLWASTGPACFTALFIVLEKREFIENLLKEEDQRKIKAAQMRIDADTIQDDEMCPCGSGKTFSNCHKQRPIRYIVPNYKLGLKVDMNNSRKYLEVLKKLIREGSIDVHDEKCAEWLVQEAEYITGGVFAFGLLTSTNEGSKVQISDSGMASLSGGSTSCDGYCVYRVAGGSDSHIYKG